MKLLALLLTLFTAVVPANAMSFENRVPSFGLYCTDENADIHGAVKYTVDEEGNAVAYSEYAIGESKDDLEFFLPFVSSSFNLPEVSITVNGQPVSTDARYGERVGFSDGTEFYSPELDESITGTLYSLIPDGDSFSVEFDAGRHSYIYLYPQSYKGKRGDKTYLEFGGAIPGAVYEIFVLGGDMTEFSSTAEIQKQTLSVKEYLDLNIAKCENPNGQGGDIEPEYFYSLVNNAMQTGLILSYSDLFFGSVSDWRVNAYYFIVPAENAPCTVTYSMPARVLKNAAFSPAIFLAEQTATGSYKTDYSIELNENFPFVIESSVEVVKRDGFTYAAQGVDGNFSFVFSSSRKPELPDTDDGTKTVIIAVCSVLGAGICVCAAGFVISVVRSKKRK